MAVCSVISLVSYAQTAPERSLEEYAQALTDKQGEKVTFQGDQENEIHAINLKYLHEMESIRAAGASLQTAESLKEMGKRKDVEVQEVLDAEQFEKYVQAKEELSEELDLSPAEKAGHLTLKQHDQIHFYGDQKDRMYEINVAFIEKIDPIMADGRSISNMMKLRDLSGEKDKSVKGILDKDQYKIYKKMNEVQREKMRSRMMSEW